LPYNRSPVLRLMKNVLSLGRLVPSRPEVGVIGAEEDDAGPKMFPIAFCILRTNLILGISVLSASCRRPHPTAGPPMALIIAYTPISVPQHN
jgi:hypothetical protein